MVALRPAGTDVYLDAVFPGLQATVEHREPIYGAANGFTARASSLWTMLFMEQQLDVELRVLALTLGGSVGWSHVYRHYEFAANEQSDREGRLIRDDEADWDSGRWPFAEGRLTLSLPFNDYVVFNGINTWRFEDRATRTFDWRNGIVRDNGMLFRSNLALFFKHRDWGAIAPLLEIQRYGIDGRRVTQLNYGFMLVTRPGLRERDDIFLFQFLWHFGDRLGGFDAGESYGQHTFSAPFTFILAYRMAFAIFRQGDQPRGEAR